MNTKSLYALFLESNSICTDTRKLKKKDIFFALKGENFNGNEFARTALNKGAKYAVIDEKKYEGKNTILVDNVLKSLQVLATYHRIELDIPIIALTGSNGKTTTKELINLVLSKKFITTATSGNLNNHIGVPLTLLSMTNKTEMGIVEMGANHLKEIEFLCKIAQPDYGLITNFGKAHLEGFGSLDGVVKGKSELYDFVKAKGKIAFINTNDNKQVAQIGKYLNIITFGSGLNNDCEVELKEANPFVVIKYNKLTINSKLIGEYNFGNIAAAVSVGDYFNVTAGNIKDAIEDYSPVNNRSEILNIGNKEIILDAYNANPSSMSAAISSFDKLDRAHKIAFLGDMFELGDESKLEHQKIIDMITNLKMDQIVLIGEQFQKTITNFDNIISFKSFEDFKSNFDFSKIKKASILVKGSRGMALERILDLL